jgi:hypothetical protein
MKIFSAQNWLALFTVFFILLASGIFFIYSVNAGTLSCSVTTAGACTGTVIWRMSGATNAHAELPSQSTPAYANNVVCCSGVTGLGNACTGTYAIALKLSGLTNAHSEQNSQANYANNACISVPSGGSVSIGYQSTNCAGFDITLGSMSGITNAHVGDGTAYTTKICATAAATVISVTISDSAVAYGTLLQNATKSTCTSELNDAQTVTNDGNVTENFNIRGQNSANWTLGATAGNNIYAHKFASSTCSAWPGGTALTTSNQTLATGIAPNGTVTLNLQINTPNPSTFYTQQSVNVIITAVQY